MDSDLRLNFLLSKLQVTDEERVAVHEATIGQRDNPNWQILRKGRLTASNFGHVLTAKRATPSLIKRVMGQYDLSRAKTFKSPMKKPVQNSGLWLTTSGILGASPDGLIEIKCPFNQRNMTVEEAVNNCKYFFV